ncbi:MAG: hypothetical protein MUC91_09870, partial [Verrucomicrobia bacterium]|nr:hypothetical protein [Verrucomicrobiota bacterium]
MNPDQPLDPREELEIQITSLLLGELEADAAARIRKAIKQDAELARLHDQLAQTLDLVKAASADLPAASEMTANAAFLRLSDDKRKALLARFKTQKPDALRKPKPRSPGIGLLELAAIFAILALLSALLLPSLGKAKAKASRIAAANDLKQVALASQLWDNDHQQSVAQPPRKEDQQSDQAGDREKYLSAAKGLEIALPSIRSQSQNLFADAAAANSPTTWGLASADGRAQVVAFAGDIGTAGHARSLEGEGADASYVVDPIFSGASVATAKHASGPEATAAWQQLLRARPDESGRGGNDQALYNRIPVQQQVEGEMETGRAGTEINGNNSARMLLESEGAEGVLGGFLQPLSTALVDEAKAPSSASQRTLLGVANKSKTEAVVRRASPAMAKAQVEDNFAFSRRAGEARRIQDAFAMELGLESSAVSMDDIEQNETIHGSRQTWSADQKRMRETE